MITNPFCAKKSRNILAALSVTLVYGNILHGKKMPQRRMREVSQQQGKISTFVKEDQEKSSSGTPPLLIFMRVVLSILLQRLLVNIHQANKADFKAKLCTPIQLLKDGRVINTAFLQDTEACHVVKQLQPSD